MNLLIFQPNVLFVVFYNLSLKKINIFSVRSSFIYCMRRCPQSNYPTPVNSGSQGIIANTYPGMEFLNSIFSRVFWA